MIIQKEKTSTPYEKENYARENYVLHGKGKELLLKSLEKNELSKLDQQGTNLAKYNLHWVEGATRLSMLETNHVLKEKFVITDRIVP